MKMFVLTVVFFMLAGCATLGPEAFVKRCTIEGFGPESDHHEQCTHHYARAFNTQQRYATGRALSAGGRAILEQDQKDGWRCSTFGDETICKPW